MSQTTFSFTVLATFCFGIRKYISYSICQLLFIEYLILNSKRWFAACFLWWMEIFGDIFSSFWLFAWIEYYYIEQHSIVTKSFDIFNRIAYKQDFTFLSLTPTQPCFLLAILENNGNSFCLHFCRLWCISCWYCIKIEYAVDHVKFFLLSSFLAFSLALFAWVNASTRWVDGNYTVNSKKKSLCLSFKKQIHLILYKKYLFTLTISSLFHICLWNYFSIKYMYLHWQLVCHILFYLHVLRLWCTNEGFYI